MSLHRKLIIATSLIIISLLVGNFVLSTVSLRVYFANQMQVLADDTATSLGMTISHSVKEKDYAKATVMIDAIFDRGFYSSIVFSDTHGKEIVSRQRELVLEGVPRWFQNVISMPESSGVAEVVSGWYQLGKVRVTPHPGYVYEKLWRTLVEQLGLFLITAILCFGLIRVGLKQFLRPLRRVEEQAEAICRKEFSVQQQLPRTPELRRMIVAMNRMAQKVKEMFQHQVDLTDSLRRDAYMDPLTELPNRKEFDARMSAWVLSEHGGSSGILGLLNIAGILELNHTMGRETGDRFIKGIAEVLKLIPQRWPGTLLARRGGSDFCIFVPGLLEKEIEPFMQQLMDGINEVDILTGIENLPVYVGVAYSKSITDIAKMLSAADTGLREVSDGGSSRWVVKHMEGDEPEFRPAGEWFKYLRKIIEDKSIVLFYQPVFNDGLNEILHYEVLCRVIENGEFIRAGTFWPLVERYGLMESMDCLVVQAALDVLSSHDGIILSVNISPLSIKQDDFMLKLDTILSERPEAARRLQFEFSERVLRLPQGTFISFANLAKKWHVKISLDNFGITPSSLGSLQLMDLEFVKIDRRFVSELDSDRENRFYVKALAQIAHSCDVKILAEGVETDQEWQALNEIGIDGGQGFWLAKPAREILET